MSYDPLDSQADPFRPPELSVEVSCLHCGLEYDSYLIEWRVETTVDGSQHGFWCCPTPGCDGRGFGFDILPTDPNYRDEPAAGAVMMKILMTKMMESTWMKWMNWTASSIRPTHLKQTTETAIRATTAPVTKTSPSNTTKPRSSLR